MIDKETGNIELGKNGFTIWFGLTKNGFLASAPGKGSREGVVNSEWSTYYLDERIFDNDIILGLTFKGSTVWNIELTLSNGSALWANWSETEELAKKATHDKLLFAALGPPPYLFKWGKVESEYDRKSGCSIISVRYQRP